MSEVAAAALLVDGEGRVLLVLERDLWQLPGGRVEFGETPREAAVREAREEVDARVEIEEELPALLFEDGFRCHLFRCAIAEGEPRATPLSRDVGWFSPQEPPSPLGRVPTRVLPDLETSHPK